MKCVPKRLMRWAATASGLWSRIVDLHHAALPDKLGMAMPGVIGAAKGQQGATQGWYLGRVILNVAAGAQHAQLAVLVLPALIEIDQHGNHLALVVGVDIAVGALTELAHGDRGGQ